MLHCWALFGAASKEKSNNKRISVCPDRLSGIEDIA
jgi:hypothetical protein